MAIAALLVQTRVWDYGSLRNFFGRLFRTTSRKRCSSEDLCVETRHLPRLHTTICALEQVVRSEPQEDLTLPRLLHGTSESLPAAR